MGVLFPTGAPPLTFKQASCQCQTEKQTVSGFKIEVIKSVLLTIYLKASLGRFIRQKPQTEEVTIKTETSRQISILN